MEVDEPYDFLTWHSNAPAAKDKKKEKKKQKELEKEAKANAGKTGKSSKNGSRKRKQSSPSDDEDSSSDNDDDNEEGQKNSKAPSKKKSKTSEPESDSDSDSDSESSESSSSEDSDDPNTLPPPKSKRKKLRKGKNKKAANKDGEGDDEEAEAPENESADENDGKEKKKKKKDKKKGKKEEQKKDGPGRKGEHGIWIGNLSFLTTEKALRHFFRGVGAGITRVNMPIGPSGAQNKKSNKGFAYVDFETPEAQANAIKLSDTDLDGRKVLIKSSKSFEGRPVTSKAALMEKSSKQKHTASPTLFIGNLSFQATRDGLQKLFEDCGEIRKVRLATFQDNVEKCRGFAYIDFMNPESAAKALTDPKKHFFQGRKLNIEYASPEATLRGNPREFRKHLRDEEAKAQAANGEDNTQSAEATEAAEEERRKHNAEQKAKRQGRQRREGPAKKPQGHQRPGFALATAQRASQGMAEYKGSKTTFD
ncbi:hypothetical protein BGX34_007722 [Mortierella sp. NVP85]|nr:hypothetical protein BGX34_007722 [Mortierella sp. NVP85]